MAAGGVAIVAVLTLRAMGEWHTIKAEREAEAKRAASALHASDLDQEPRDVSPPSDQPRSG